MSLRTFSNDEIKQLAAIQPPLKRNHISRHDKADMTREEGYEAKYDELLADISMFHHMYFHLA